MTCIAEFCCHLQDYMNARASREARKDELPECSAEKIGRIITFLARSLHALNGAKLAPSFRRHAAYDDQWHSNLASKRIKSMGFDVLMLLETSANQNSLSIWRDLLPCC